MDVQDAIDELQRRLAHYPPDRYPVQHATAQFHLGAVLTDAGRLPEAESALNAAAVLFDPEGLAAEHAKVRNALGAVYRLAGRPDDAIETFRRAAALFDAAGLSLEHGAALFNLGLTHRDRNDHEAAADWFGQARDRFGADSAPAEAAAAERELGAVLLVTGELDRARDTLESAVELADRAGDPASLGAAANLLGLVHLADNRPEAAVAALRNAVGAHPRTVRPGEHAMAKANLALAHERAGAPDPAYLAAVQALGTPGAAEPVRAQAEAVVHRLGVRRGALLAVLDQEPQQRWPTLLREELARWADAGPDEQRAESGGWIDGQAMRPGAAAELAEVWLNGLLELPPEAMTSLIRATLEASAQRDADAVEQFRSAVGRAVVRFPVPQWTRLRDTFNRVAAELGQDTSWG